MELEYGFLYNQEIKKSLDKIFTANMHGALLANVNKIQRNLEKHFLLLKKEFETLVKAHSELDEKGNLIEPNGPGSYKIKEGELAVWNKNVVNLMAKRFTLEKCGKINLNQLLNSGISLSSIDIQHLEPILDGIEISLE